jgi:putative SOS response-associated peptidase YedK
MCGRFTLRAPPQALADEFELAEVSLFEPRFNIAPTQSVPAIRLHDGGRQLAQFRWGLVPFWADDPKIGYRLINARSESAASKAAFRDAFKKRRCLVLADGFYEWKKSGKTKQPFHIRRADGKPFAFAGLWERWQPPDGEPLETCTILTTTANATLSALHDRMPVILERPDRAAWLDPAAAKDDLQALLRPLPDDALTAVPVSTYVNSPRNQGPQCLEAVEAPT